MHQLRVISFYHAFAASVRGAFFMPGAWDQLRRSLKTKQAAPQAAQYIHYIKFYLSSSTSIVCFAQLSAFHTTSALYLSATSHLAKCPPACYIIITKGEHNKTANHLKQTQITRVESTDETFDYINVPTQAS